MSGYELLINEVARIAGCHPNTVKNYTDKGVIPDTRDANGFRRYRLDDALRLKEILQHRETAQPRGMVSNR